MYWFLLAFKRSFDFKGRSRRLEFWMFMLLAILVSFGTYVAEEIASPSVLPVINIISIIASLAFLIPSLSVTVRRFHDLNKNAWFVYVVWALGCISVLLSVFNIILLYVNEELAVQLFMYIYLTGAGISLVSAIGYLIILIMSMFQG